MKVENEKFLKTKAATLAAWAGLEVIDATKELRIQPSVADLRKAKPLNPARCVFAQCAKRQYGARGALFFRSRAYLDLLDPKGKRRVERFTIERAARGLISDFDAGKQVVLRGFLLVPPTKTQTLKGHREYMAKRHAAIQAGTWNPNHNKQAKRTNKGKKRKLVMTRYRAAA